MAHTIDIHYQKNVPAVAKENPNRKLEYHVRLIVDISSYYLPVLSLKRKLRWNASRL